jgi:hypothetical protein
MVRKLALVATPFPQGFTGLGSLAVPGDQAQATGLFEQALSVTVGVMTVVAGIWYMFQFFSAAISWLSAGADKNAVQNAQKKLLDSTTGLVVIVLSYVLISIIGRIVGFDLILNPASIILNSLSI